MRPLDKVMDATLKLIPQDFPKRDELQKGFDNLKKDLRPEVVPTAWFIFATEISHALGEPDTKWKEEIVALLKGEKDYQDILNG